MNISILGSTGSIGTQTLDVVRQNDDMNITVLTAGSNVSLLEKQIREFKPRMVSVKDEAAARDLSARIKDIDIPVLCGNEGLIEAAVYEDADTVVTSVVGMLAVRPTIEAVRAGKKICQANKESIVTAGHIIMPLIKETGASLLPVDSEHSAIFQCLSGERGSNTKLEKILLTASGGPFLGKKADELENVTVEQALNHPRWHMGRKITIDSSTLVNKGLEVMEAKWLFDAELDQIQVVVHPQSIVHSMVQFSDGAVIAQLGPADMRIPILYALCYPERRPLNSERLDFYSLSRLTFMEPDMENFPGLKLAFDTMKRGGNMPTVYNAANERAVDLFLNEKIRYPEITQIIEFAMENTQFMKDPDIDDILDTEREVYERIDARMGL